MQGGAAKRTRQRGTMANNDNGAGILVAFIAGAAVGAAVALLFAPATGEETREYLGQRAREGRDRAADAARQGRELLNRQRDNITNAFDRARQQFQAGPARSRTRERVFLGIIAVAVLVMAIIQVAAIVFAARAARSVGEAVSRFEQDVRPIVANLQTHVGRRGARDGVGDGAGRADAEDGGCRARIASTRRRARRADAADDSAGHPGAGARGFRDPAGDSRDLFLVGRRSAPASRPRPQRRGRRRVVHRLKFAFDARRVTGV